MPKHTPLTLLILDGWGYREPAADNAIAMADTPHWDALWRDAPHALLETGGLAVGLPDGQMGNSEVGHMNIGAGRIVYQELTRIDQAIKNSELAGNQAVLNTIESTRAADGTLHLLGLVSPGGVHSHERHLFALLDILAPTGVPVAVHAFLDGRDTPPRSALPSLQRLSELLERNPNMRIASISGRYYAMDRDRRWERTEKAWLCVVEGRGDRPADSAVAALDEAYRRGEDDEFVTPTVIAPACPIADGDGVLFFNFRADRARQLSQALINEDFAGFDRVRPKLAVMTTMTQYQDDLPVQVAFPPQRLHGLFGEVLAQAGLRQLRIAETEKYAHVTYFFNGGQETVFAGEQRVLIPSPKVATYDLRPEMSAAELGRRLTAAISGAQFDVIIANVANPDMVGHTGSMPAAMAAVETVDQLLGEVLRAVRGRDGELLVTADHGNVEQMLDPETGQPHTAHTTNPVPLVLVSPRDCRLRATGSLRDIAPSMLNMLNLDVPAEMNGTSLVSCRE